MRPVTIVMIVAVLAAGGTALLAKSWLDRQTSTPVVQTETVEVLVVARPVAPGTALQSADLRYESWPAKLVPARMIRHKPGEDTKAHYVGQLARRGLAEGEPLTQEALSGHDDLGAMAALLRPGMRAISVPITNSSAVSGFIMPGDHVDVVLAADLSKTLDSSHQTPNKDIVRFASETVLSDVRVLAIDQALSRDKDGAPIQGKTATIEVTPKQAETLTTIGMLGNVQLVLRGRPQEPATAATPESPPFSSDIAVSKALRQMVEDNRPVVAAAKGHGAGSVVRVNRAGVVTAQGVAQ